MHYSIDNVELYYQFKIHIQSQAEKINIYVPVQMRMKGE